MHMYSPSHRGASLPSLNGETSGIKALIALCSSGGLAAARGIGVSRRGQWNPSGSPVASPLPAGQPAATMPAPVCQVSYKKRRMSCGKCGLKNDDTWTSIIPVASYQAILCTKWPRNARFTAPVFSGHVKKSTCKTCKNWPHVMSLRAFIHCYGWCQDPQRCLSSTCHDSTSRSGRFYTRLQTEGPIHGLWNHFWLSSDLVCVYVFWYSSCIGHFQPFSSTKARRTFVLSDAFLPSTINEFDLSGTLHVAGCVHNGSDTAPLCDNGSLLRCLSVAVNRSRLDLRRRTGHLVCGEHRPRPQPQ